MGIDIDNSIKIITGIVAAAASIAMYLRSERVKNADADADVANYNLETTTHNGQAEEIISLRDRLNNLDSAFVAQAAALHEQASRISILEATHLGVSMHVGNLMLCEQCTINNAKVLAALNKALDSAEVDNPLED